MKRIAALLLIPSIVSIGACQKNAPSTNPDAAVANTPNDSRGPGTPSGDSVLEAEPDESEAAEAEEPAADADEADASDEESMDEEGYEDEGYEDEE